MRQPSKLGRTAGERRRLDGVADWYVREQLDLDRHLIHFRYQTFKPYVKGPQGLELGPADGEMTARLLHDFERLTVVDASAALLSRLPDAPNLVKVHALFEEFRPRGTFNTVVADHVLEHVEDPVALLRRIGGWVAESGRVLVGVPNGHSIHRLAAVKMGLLAQPCELSPRDKTMGHRRVYVPDTLRRDLAAGGLRVIEMGGVFLKPLPQQHIQDHWTPEMIRGFFELGKDFPDVAADLYAVCEITPRNETSVCSEGDAINRRCR